MKPTVRLIGENGNVFNLASIVSNALKKEGLKKEAEEFKSKLFQCKSYDEALRLMMDYVEIE
jgi:hypothetical protein